MLRMAGEQPHSLPSAQLLSHFVQDPVQGQDITPLERHNGLLSAQNPVCPLLFLRKKKPYKWLPFLRRAFRTRLQFQFVFFALSIMVGRALADDDDRASRPRDVCERPDESARAPLSMGSALPLAPITQSTSENAIAGHQGREMGTRLRRIRRSRAILNTRNAFRKLRPAILR